MAGAGIAQAMARPAALLKEAAFGQTRMAAVVRTAVTSIFTRGFSMAATLLTVPLVLHHVGQERYGIWMTAIALSTLFAVADGGVTNGLIALVAKANGAGDRARIGVLMSSGLAVTAAFVLVFAITTLTIVGLVDWTWAFNLTDPALDREAGAVIAIICLFMAASFPATVFRESRLGLLQGARVNLWDSAGLVIGFAGLLAAIWSGWGLLAIAAIWAGAPVLARVAGALMFLAGPGRDLRPSWRKVEAAASRSLIKSGSVYVLYSITQLLAMQSAPVLIARFLGASAVADFTVVQRLFLQPQVLITIGLTAQWPAYAEAFGRGDFAWIKRHLKRSLAAYALFAAVAHGLLAIFCGPILYVWVGNAITVPKFLVPAMFVFGIVTAVASVFAFFYLSLGRHRSLIFGQTATVAIALPLSFYLIPIIGSPGAAAAAAAGYLAAFVVPGILYSGTLTGIADQAGVDKNACISQLSEKHRDNPIEA